VSERLPPRQLVLSVIPLYVLLALLVVCCAPLWLAIAWLCGVASGQRGRLARCAAFLLLYLLVESVALVVMGGWWLASGCGRRLTAPEWQERHYRLLARLLAFLYRAARSWLGLSVQLDDESVRPEQLARPGSFVVLSRHAGPGDSFLLVHLLLNGFGLRPRIVIKATLQLDPCVNVIGHRLPNAFVSSGSDPNAVGRIAELARGLGDRDALLLFPEGGNYSPRRRRRRIHRLWRRGEARRARTAESLEHVLVPERRGTTAALAAAPSAGVLLVAHSGLAADPDGPLTQRLPTDRTMCTRLWQLASDAVPGDDDGRAAFLDTCWRRIDDWVAETVRSC
jgi:1-acyl-sn-glycerol-3-phosphate acyltransferase